MKFITNSKFRTLPIISERHNLVRLYNENYVIKVTLEENLPVLKKLAKKSPIDKVLLPEEFYRYMFSSRYKYAYTMEYAKGFYDLTNFELFQKLYSDKEILMFFKKMLLTLRDIHQNNIYSGDIWSDNIIIDKNLDYRFIDFDLAFTNNLNIDDDEVKNTLFISYFDERMLDSNYSLYEQVACSDKLQLLNLIIRCILDGNFYKQRHFYPNENSKHLELPESINKKFLSLTKAQVLPEKDDYFIDEIDTLIERQYKLLYRKRK